MRYVFLLLCGLMLFGCSTAKRQLVECEKKLTAIDKDFIQLRKDYVSRGNDIKELSDSLIVLNVTMGWLDDNTYIIPHTTVNDHEQSLKIELQYHKMQLDNCLMKRLDVEDVCECDKIRNNIMFVQGQQLIINYIKGKTDDK